jgi:hypothetical protein
MDDWRIINADACVRDGQGTRWLFYVHGSRCAPPARAVPVDPAQAAQVAARFGDDVWDRIQLVRLYERHTSWRHDPQRQDLHWLRAWLTRELGRCAVLAWVLPAASETSTHAPSIPSNHERQVDSLIDSEGKVKRAASLPNGENKKTRHHYFAGFIFRAAANNNNARIAVEARPKFIQSHEASEKTVENNSQDTSAIEQCRKIFLHAYLGKNSDPGFKMAFKARLLVAKSGNGDLNILDVLLWSGHVGFSFDSNPDTIWGFNPDIGSVPLWQALEHLKEKDSFFPGHITDDSIVFSHAADNGVEILIQEIIYPATKFNTIFGEFESHLSKCPLRYSFPGGKGDCNCATYPGRIKIWIPEQTGQMKDFIQALQATYKSSVRMGNCG